MALVNFQVLEGLERGQTFTGLATPVTIGREDENNIQLNDDRVSRFHAKVQEDGGRLILTDLDSTNGTRVNGHPIQLRVLQTGDLVSIGRCLLLYWDANSDPPRTQSDDDFLIQPGELLDSKSSLRQGELLGEASDEHLVFDEDLSERKGDHELFPYGPPEIPQDLRPVQRAQLSDLIAYLHEQIATVLQAAREVDTGLEAPRAMHIEWAQWQRLVRLEQCLSVALRRIAGPEAE